MALTNTILAGDIGGTKTLLGLFTCNNERPEPLVITRYSTQDYEDAKNILRDFICKHAHGMNIDAATLGVAQRRPCRRRAAPGGRPAARRTE